ncbi:adaptin ear-binding coat-associated protein [Rhizoctonia solani AG-3 Rhs1AP]|uniref:Adaptin ear-binding coat-associated protein n=2 Tax=Rhizoctonia solani AG-3 TaxID=1086053 RepID=A0A074S8D4_9AGAM|nr:adaptin ear-binding coat-associated protein [Rhizoctonia solani AG-3 Rhs1AP]KEP55504.1 adaptin ear-binding coat-associated protein [Rhizoctonia solani 123E]
MEDDDIESILFICREAMVFKIPPRQSNAGYRAAEWGDLGSPLWKGRMRIIERNTGCMIRLEDPQTGEVFAQAPYDVTGLSVEAVLDSSRYFVLRAEDQGRKAYIGVGFAERAESFDFNVALQDYTKRQKALLNPETNEGDTSSPHLPTGPKKDYSLKEGQTFSINIPGARSGGSSNPQLTSDSSGIGMSFLPPPPKGPSRR